MSIERLSAAMRVLTGAGGVMAGSLNDVSVAHPSTGHGVSEQVTSEVDCKRGGRGRLVTGAGIGGRELLLLPGSA